MNRIKIVAVDDDLTSRNLIKSYLAGNTEFEVAADFADGKSAIDWLRENEIDIILCDMQMPMMNGIEFIQMARVIKEFIPVIAISSFDDYNYTRGCMINGAADYLLKHELTTEKLVDVLNQVRNKYKIQPEGTAVRHRVGYCIEDKGKFTAEYITQLAATSEIDLELVNLYPIAISPDYRLTGNVNYSEYKNDINQAVLDITAQFLSAEYKYVVCRTSEKHLLLLLSCGNKSSMLYMMTAINDFCNKLRRRVVRMLDITLTIGVGSLFGNLSQAIAQCLRLDDLLLDKFYLGGNRSIQIEMANKLTYHFCHIPVQQWSQLSFELTNTDRLGAKSILHDIFKQLEDEKCPQGEVCNYAYKMLDTLAANNMLHAGEMEEYHREVAAAEMFDQLSLCILDLYDQKIGKAEKQRQAQLSPAIAKSMEYICQNFSNDISLVDCAVYVNTSYTHLSREFRKETGLRFVEYLNMVRINKAKSLLIRHKYSMKEIVDMVGFRNYNYFFKVFKENEGLTPNEFATKNYSES